jgi:hypothetical protein
MAALKTGLDTVKTALDIFKQAKDSLPNGEGKNQISNALNQATEKLAEGEAAVASALGFTLCRCAFPPTPMLMVGSIPIRHLSGIDRGQALSSPIYRLLLFITLFSNCGFFVKAFLILRQNGCMSLNFMISSCSCRFRCSLRGRDITRLTMVSESCGVSM